MLTYDLTARGRTPIYEYLYHCLRSDILSGKLASGEKLPGKRALAEHLGVSVITVEAAYSQLEAEGCVEARPRRGFYVCAGAMPAVAASQGCPPAIRDGERKWKLDLRSNSVGKAHPAGTLRGPGRAAHERTSRGTHGAA